MTKGAGKVARLILNDAEIDLPLHEGSEGPNVIDVSQLGSQGYFTYDPGFASTASCDSRITYIDGEAGILLHRGYPIEQLAQHSDYLEVCHLLLHGELPEAAEKQRFVKAVRRRDAADETLAALFRGFRRDAHPMAMLIGALGGLAALHHEGLDIQNPAHRLTVAERLLGQMPALAAMCCKVRRGEPFVPPRSDLDYAANLLHMAFAAPGRDWEVNPMFAKAMDRILLLHADHEQNASTSTVRLAGSTGANPFACIAGGIAALWGPAHGGANEAVLNMLDRIGSERNIDKFVRKAKDKSDPFRLMGFGHRVYKNYDPRAKVIQQTCHELFEALDLEDSPLLRMAHRLERIALEDDYFVTRKLYPNVDFYSGIIFKAIGIPVDMFTVIFAAGRAAGWVAHWHEMLDGPHRLGRPRQLYLGPRRRNFVPLEER